MTRHRFRWEALTFGLAFLGVVSLWSSWSFDLFDPDQLAYVASGGLIVLGVAGIIASFASPRPPVESASPATETATETEEVPDEPEEETDAQS